MKLSQNKTENEAAPEAAIASENRLILPSLIQKILEKIEAVSRAEKEIRRNEELKIEAGNDLKIAATPGISVADSRKKILDARLTVDLCDAKDETLSAALVTAQTELLNGTKEAATKFNEIVSSARRRHKDRIQTSIAQAIGGSEEFELYMNRGGAGAVEAALYNFDRTFFDSTVHFVEGRRARQWSEKNVAKLLIAHVERHAGFLGIET